MSDGPGNQFSDAPGDMDQAIGRNAHAQIGGSTGLAEHGFETDDLAKIGFFPSATQATEITEGNQFIQANIRQIITAEGNQQRCFFDVPHQRTTALSKRQVRTGVVYAMHHSPAETLNENVDQRFVRRTINRSGNKADASSALQRRADGRIEFAPGRRNDGFIRTFLRAVLQTIRVIQIQQRRLRPHISGTASQRMIGITFDLNRTAIVGFDHHRHRTTGIAHGGTEIHRLADSAAFWLMRVRHDGIGMLLVTASQGKHRRSAGQLHETTAIHRR